MSVLLFMLGVVVAASAIVALGFGIQLNEFPMGPALISGGATGLTGGFILIGLSAVVGELARLANDLKGNELRVGERRGDGLEGLAAPVVAAPMPPVPATVSAPGRQPAPNLPLPPRPRTDFPAQRAGQLSIPPRLLRSRFQPQRSSACARPFLVRKQVALNLRHRATAKRRRYRRTERPLLTREWPAQGLSLRRRRPPKIGLTTQSKP